MKPILKWAGGKTQLLDILRKQMPTGCDFSSMTYIEPFVGAGALFLYLLEEDIFNKYVINDINSKLINLYIKVRDDLEELITELTNLKEQYISYEEGSSDREKMYYDIRDRFNILTNEKNIENEDCIKQASYFIFLNKTCFNGLYRENSRGEFNVPFGRYKNPSFFDKNELEKLSMLLNKRDSRGELKVKILNKNYLNLENIIDKNCFVYLDPPYRPVTIGGFNSYNKGNFNDDSQIELSKFYKVLDKIDTKLMLSNSDPKVLYEEDTFFDDLYSDFNIKRVHAKRFINSKGNGRGFITELLITNYEEVGNQMELVKNIHKNKSKDEIFKELLENLKGTIASWDYYVNWNKALENTRKIEVQLNILNYLIGKEDIENETKNLLKEYPEVLSVIPIVIASRDNEFKILDPSDEDMFKYKLFNFKKRKSISDEESELATEFLKKIKFLDLLKQKNIKNLVDYVFGVEVGLDTNARKNRTGSSMETLVERYVKNMCEKNNWSYLTQATVKKISEKWSIEVPTDKSKRKYDFAINNNGKIVLVEVNFYNGGGSKLKSVANEFTKLDKYIKDGGFTFCWITDGLGWLESSIPLRDAFDKMDYIFNLDMVDKGSLEYIIKNL
ncbi:TPA: DpnII family type II restriction endonuclease [Clostridioides difficile]